MIVGVLLGILIGVIAVGYFAFIGQRLAHQEALSFVVGQLERERTESKVFRNLLFPVLAKTQPEVRTLDDIKKDLPSYSGKLISKDVLDKRTPFRIRFKQGMAKLNTKQRNTDALAAALAKQPSQEKTNV